MQMHDRGPETFFRQSLRAIEKAISEATLRPVRLKVVIIPLSMPREFLRVVAGHQQMDVVGTERRRLIGDGLLQVGSDAAHDRLGDMKDTRTCGFVHGVIRLRIPDQHRPQFADRLAPFGNCSSCSMFFYDLCIEMSFAQRAI